MKIKNLFSCITALAVVATCSFGPNQFAYSEGRGARDALAMLVLTWVQALAARRKVVVYCSDASGAFDRIRMERLVAKLKAKRVHPDVVSALASWLRPRRVHVVVEGQQSTELSLHNMVFQGTVLGPMLWN